MKKEMFATVVPCSARPLIYDEALCVGCNRCAQVCQVDILLPNPEKGKPPTPMTAWTFRSPIRGRRPRIGLAPTRWGAMS